jgi:hypothetical protein
MFYEVKYKDQLKNNNKCSYYLTDLQWKYFDNPKKGFLTGRWVFMGSDGTIDLVSARCVCGAWPLDDLGLLRLVTDERLKRRLNQIFNEDQSNKTA